MNKTLGNYQIMIASKYFDSIEDFINLEIAVKRFYGNMERFHFNPIPLNECSRKLFPNLETLHLYEGLDRKFKDAKIFKHCIWYYIVYQRYLEEKEKGNVCKYWENKIDYKGILKTNNVIDLYEMKQIESWTGMEMRQIIFDSNVDNWNVNTSVFHQKIINKSNLIFLIEDDGGNKFGGYLNAKIDGFGCIKDPKSFLFSLKSNGRLKGMSKFYIQQSQHAFFLYNKLDIYLFSFGGCVTSSFGCDIKIRKENIGSESSCDQISFNYKGIQNALCGKSPFTPKRITVIQLI